MKTKGNENYGLYSIYLKYLAIDNKFEPKTRPALFCKTTIACTPTVHYVHITRVIYIFS